MYGEKRNAYMVLVWKPEGKRPFGRTNVGVTSEWVLKNRKRGCGLDSSGSHSVK